MAGAAKIHFLASVCHSFHFFPGRGLPQVAYIYMARACQILFVGRGLPQVRCMAGAAKTIRMAAAIKGYVCAGAVTMSFFPQKVQQVAVAAAKT